MSFVTTHVLDFFNAILSRRRKMNKDTLPRMRYRNCKAAKLHQKFYTLRKPKYEHQCKTRIFKLHTMVNEHDYRKAQEQSLVAKKTLRVTEYAKNRKRLAMDVFLGCFIQDLFLFLR